MRVIWLAAACWLLTVLLRTQHLDQAFDLERAQVSAEGDFIQSPGREVLRLAAFEHALAWADFIWLAMVQETGKEKPDWNRVVRWTGVGTDLDPKYFTIYHAAAIHLSVFGKRVEDADALLLKGWNELPLRWQLPMLLGYNAYFVRGDALSGSDYMRAAADTPGSPVFLAALAGRMRYHGGDAAGAIEMLESMLPALDGDARRDAEERILLLRSEPILAAYDRACRAYLKAVGEVPTAAQLFREGYVEVPPRDLLGYEVYMDSGCIARTEVIRIRESEAIRERLGTQKSAPVPEIPDEVREEIIGSGHN